MAKVKTIKAQSDDYIEPPIDQTIHPSDPTKNPIVTITMIRRLTGFGLAEAKFINDVMKIVQATRDSPVDITFNRVVEIVKTLLET